MMRLSPSFLGLFPRGGGGVSYSAEATAYFAAMSVAPDDTRKGHLNTLIAGLKTDGVWSNLDGLFLFASHDAQAARVNAKAPGTVATAVNSPTFTTDRSYAGNGSTSYLRLGFNASGGAGQYQQNSCHMGVWVRSNVTSSTQNDLGTFGASVNPRNSGNASVSAQSGTGSTAALPAATSVGHTAWSRTGATAGAIYKDGASIGTFATASTTLRNAEFFALALNSSSTGSVAPLNFSTREIAAVHFGGALDGTKTAALYNRLATYMTAVGAL